MRKSFGILAYGVMTKRIYELSGNPGPSLREGTYRPEVRISSFSLERADPVARVLPPELAFLAAEGFSPEPLLSAVGGAPKAIGPLDQLLSEGRMSEEFYYRTLARHLGCQYYCGEPPLAQAFDASKDCAAALLRSNGAAPVPERSSRLVRSSYRGLSKRLYLAQFAQVLSR
jgi:hypothetical protein